MRASFVAAVALLPSAAFATFSFISPSNTEFWVANATNFINWTTTAGDPSTFNILLINENNVTLNGAFAIASSVNNSQASFAVTNVTILPGDDYIVQFVNITDPSQVFANSSTFTVEPSGSTPAPAASSSSASSGSSGTGSAGSSGTGTSSGSAANPTKTNGASSLLNTKSAVAAAGAMALAALAL